MYFGLSQLELSQSPLSIVEVDRKCFPKLHVRMPEKHNDLVGCPEDLFESTDPVASEERTKCPRCLQETMKRTIVVQQIELLVSIAD